MENVKQPPKNLEAFKAAVCGELRAYSANYTSYIVRRHGRRIYGYWDYTQNKYIEQNI